MKLNDTMQAIALAPIQMHLAALVDDMWLACEALGWAAGWSRVKHDAAAAPVYEWLAEVQIMRICVAGCEVEHKAEIRAMAQRCVVLFGDDASPELAPVVARVRRGLGGAL